MEQAQADLNFKGDQLEHVYAVTAGENDNVPPSSLMIEIEQLKEDNRRLMAMLRETKEYQDFMGYVDDSGGHVRATDT